MYTKLAEKLIDDYQNTGDSAVRERYGVVAGIAGILTNTLLFIVKFIIGLVTASIAVTTDAFNNLSDVLSSVVTITSFKVSGKPADAEHPFGHGRVEYMASLVVGVLVLLVGAEFFQTSIEKMIDPPEVTFQWIPFLLLLLSAGLKVWLGMLNKNYGKRIDSGTLKATASDAFSDVLSSLGVSLSLVFSPLVGFPLDGAIGLAVSLMILRSGYSILKENIVPLMGGRPDPGLVKTLIDEINSFPYVLGCHDLLLNNYGPGRYFATIHMEFPADMTAVQMHDIAGEAEQVFLEKYRIHLTVHMDPVDLNDQELAHVRERIEDILSAYKEVVSSHDYRIIRTAGQKDLVFDVVMDFHPKRKIKSRAALVEYIRKDVARNFPEYRLVLTADLSYD